MGTEQGTKLEGLSEKIFLDRYAWKHADSRQVKVGDTVLVLTKDDSKFPTKQVGEVTELSSAGARVQLRSGEVVDTTTAKLSLTIEKTPEEMWDRLAKAMASAELTEDKRGEWQERFRYILDDWKLVPGGRIAAGAGASEELTLFNCYVIPSPKDSRGGIMKSLSEMTEIMARGGGVGMNLSSLRPRRSIVAGVNGASSGSVSWGGLFSYTTGLIEQGGSRRGALMLMINDWHPDVMEFITVKQTMGQVTSANLSVCVSNAFMHAVKEDLDWELVFPDTREEGYDELWTGDLEAWRKSGKKVIPYKTVRARDIWQTIIESAWKSAEPGVVFMEYYNQMSNSWYFNPIISTNPCFHPDTRISTEFGLMRIEDLYRKVGNAAFSIVTDNRVVEQADVVGGRSYEVTGSVMRNATVFPTGYKKTLKVILSNGMELKVTPEHRIYTASGWKEARLLNSADQVYIQSGQGGFPEQDGLGAEWGVKLASDLLRESISDVVLDCLFTASKVTVTAFLQSLFSVGCKLNAVDEIHHSVRLTLASRKHLQDIQLLLLNLGIHGQIHEQELVITGDNLVVFQKEIGFKFITRKQEALDRIARKSRKQEKFVSKVLTVEEDEAVQVYDINEPVTHSLVANGMIVHNCGEQGLPAWGVCNLSAVNLSRFYDEEKHDVAWDELAKVTRWSVRFLDNVIETTPYHFEENERNQKLERRIGLGTMGLAELMIKLRIRYGSPESLAFLDKLYAFMARESYLASAEIAGEKGSFKAFKADPFLQSGFMRNITERYPEVGQAIKDNGMRNVTVLTQAPTGSTGTMVGTSTGIEPYFAFEYYRQSRLGHDKQYVPIAAQWKEEHPGKELPDYFVTSMSLSAEDHIRVQAAIQRWVDSSISKTANCPADFTVEETARLYELAFELGCKGVTIYRDGSRDVQVLSTKKEDDKQAPAAIETMPVEEITPQVEETKETQSLKAGQVLDKEYKRRPQVLKGATYKVNTPFGMAYITINDLNGSPAEIFLNVGKAGSDVFAMAEALGRVCSLFLRYGDHGNKSKLLIKHLKGIGGSGAIGFGANRVESIADAVAKALEIHTEGTEEYAAAVEAPTIQADNPHEDHHADTSRDLCPSCGSATLINIEGCKQCSMCGYSKCN
ncbi:TSCPD domain-containing protein [Paenibacillus harenae]|uniref:Vitamin B12-dependent ribonucleotide reductase n=1 Tax=Paenibacillus harenae TaxID=306543 RepID=A0ABT9TZK5_PAEHA|nr:LAGLIDADG family homing endonuclease [Paenibacillus harenae]MDQ0112791.1 ribonucleotide reductase alpha subunit [Paenibacillus harenae]